MTFVEATKKAEEMTRQNRHNIYFIMGKENVFDVFAGWDGRDEALKNGFVFPKYSMRRGEYVTDYAEFDMDIID